MLIYNNVMAETVRYLLLVVTSKSLYFNCSSFKSIYKNSQNMLIQTGKGLVTASVVKGTWAARCVYFNDE